MEEYEAAFGEIGMPVIADVVRQIIELVPPALRDPGNSRSLREFVSARHNDLTELTIDFIAACVGYVPVAARYVREHMDEFECA